MPGQSASNRIDLLQIVRRKQKLLPTSAGFEYVDGRINPLIADLSIQNHLHVAGTFELVENELIHLGSGLNQRRRHDRQRAGLFRVTRSSKELARYLHGPRIQATAHGTSTP